MNRQQFFNELNTLLNQLPKKERNKTITYYNELINDYIEDGLPEEVAIAKLGNLQSIANEILLDNGKTPNSRSSSGSKIFIAILLVLGFPLWGSILLAGALLLLSFYIILFCPILVFGICSIAFFGSSIVCIIVTPLIIMENLAYSLVQLGVGIFLLGLSIVFACLTIQITKYIVKTSSFIWKKLLSVFKKRGV